MNSRISGVCSALRISLFMRSTIGRGVPRGANIAYQLSASNPGMIELIDGTSGKYADGLGVVTATARALPLLTCTMSDGAVVTQ